MNNETCGKRWMTRIAPASRQKHPEVYVEHLCNMPLGHGSNPDCHCIYCGLTWIKSSKR